MANNIGLNLCPFTASRQEEEEKIRDRIIEDFFSGQSVLRSSYPDKILRRQNAEKVLRLFNHEFGTYCYENLMYHEKFGCFPKLNDFSRFSEISFPHRLKFVKEHKNKLDLTYISLCQLAIEAQCVLEVDKDTDIIFDILDNVCEQFLNGSPPWTEYSYVAMKELLQEPYNISVPPPKPKIDLGPLITTIPSVESEKFLRPSFAELPSDRVLKSGDSLAILDSALNHVDKYRGRPITVMYDEEELFDLPPQCVLDPGSIELGLDLSECRPELQQELIKSGMFYSDTTLSQCWYYPTVMILTDRKSRYWCKRILKVGRVGTGANVEFRPGETVLDALQRNFRKSEFYECVVQ